MSVMTEIERGLTNRKSQMCKAVLSPIHLQFFMRQLTDDETKSKTSTKREIFAPQSLLHVISGKEHGLKLFYDCSRSS